MSAFRNALLQGAMIFTVIAGLGCGAAAVAAADEAKPTGYQGVNRAWLFNPVLNDTVITTKFKKAPPYTIGFSNASISNAWRVAFQHGVLWAAGQHRNEIKHFIVTDANDDPTKQINDIQDLINQGVDLLLIASATEDALDAVVGRATKAGIPVVMVDRKVKTDSNYITFVTSSDAVVGRVEAQWLAERLGGKGNIVMLPGIAGASPAEIRIKAAEEVLGNYPNIHVLDMQYTNWNPATGKSVMAALIQKYGKKIDGVLADSALQGSGAIEAFVAAGYKAGEIPAGHRRRHCQDVSVVRRVQGADDRDRLSAGDGHPRRQHRARCVARHSGAAHRAGQPADRDLRRRRHSLRQGRPDAVAVCQQGCAGRPRPEQRPAGRLQPAHLQSRLSEVRCPTGLGTRCAGPRLFRPGQHSTVRRG